MHAIMLGAMFALVQGGIDGEGLAPLTAESALAEAKAVKFAARGTKGEARLAALKKACRAFESVAEEWPQEGKITAEAAFRAAEIHRTMGNPGLARGQFEVSFDAGRGTLFAPRALIEVAHLERRAKKLEKALAMYERASTLEETPQRYQNDCREWIGKVYLNLKKWDQAMGSFDSWKDHAENPVEAIQAVDLKAKAQILAGHFEEALDTLHQIQLENAVLVGEPTKEAVKVAQALERMKSPGLLQKAKAKEERKALEEAALQENN